MNFFLLVALLASLHTQCTGMNRRITHGNTIHANTLQNWLQDNNFENPNSVIQYKVNYGDEGGEDYTRSTFPLKEAIKQENAMITELLLNAKVKVNYQDEYTSTALGELIYDWVDGKHPNVLVFLKLLIIHGADVNVKIIDGKTPLHVVAAHWSYNRAKDIIRTLVASEADLHARDNNVRTPRNVLVSSGWLQAHHDPELFDLLTPKAKL